MAADVPLTLKGVIAVGMKADINVINLGELNLLKPEMVADLPTGAKRWMQSATGVLLFKDCKLPLYIYIYINGCYTRVINNCGTSA